MTQIRVHELASELNVSTQQVLSILEDLGKKVRGPSTVIGVSAAAKVRGRFRASKPAPVVSLGESRSELSHERPLDVLPSSTTSDDVSAPAVQRSSVATPVAASAQSSLFLPPVAPAAAPTAPRTTGAFANPFAVPSATAKTTRPPARPVPSMPQQPRGPGNRVSSTPVAPVVAPPEPDHDAEWERRGISKADQETWLANGLRPSESGMADRCASADIAPTDLGKKLSGRTALQRLRDGEASTSVWARIREAEQQPRRAGTKLTGRFQLS